MYLHTRKESTLHPLISGAGRLTRAGLATLAGALALAVVHTTPSEALGTYIHQSCMTGADIVDAYGGWQSSGYPINGNTNANQCPWGGLHSEMYPAATIPLGSSMHWTYTAPAHTSITRFTGDYAGWTKSYDVNQGLYRFLNAAGAVGLTYSGGAADPDHKRRIDWAGLNTSAITAELVCDGAAGNPGCLGSTAWSSLYFPKLYLADDLPPAAGATAGSLTTDTTLKGTESLSYSASDDGGGIARLRLYVDGVATAVDHVIDTNGGHCQVGGTENGSWIFSWPKPCPGAVNADESINTLAIADGQHTITAKVVDAAQREATLWTGSRRVANHPPVNTQLPLYADQDPAVNPIVGHVITASSDGTWTGPNLNLTRAWVRCDGHGTIASCAAIPGAVGLSYTPTADDVGHRLRLLVTATNPADSVAVYSQPTGIVTAPSSAEPITPKPDPGKDGNDGKDGSDGTSSSVSINVPSAPALPAVSVSATIEHTFRGHIAGEAAGATCPQDRATLKFEHVRGGRLKLGFGKASTAQVQLTCTTTGKAIEGAQLDIATRMGTKAAVAADVATDGAGHATLRLAKGASRAVTVGYRMYADDPIARAIATLKVVVNGRVLLKANHKHLHNGQAVRLRGALAGGEVPARGVTLAVQWKDGHRWRPFAQIKTNRKGTFAYAYKFTRTKGKITYALRVQVTKGQVDYPYIATASKPVKVIVAR
jgi:hypothetical protein